YAPSTPTGRCASRSSNFSRATPGSGRWSSVPGLNSSAIDSCATSSKPPSPADQLRSPADPPAVTDRTAAATGRLLLLRRGLLFSLGPCRHRRNELAAGFCREHGSKIQQEGDVLAVDLEIAAHERHVEIELAAQRSQRILV